MDSNRYLRTSFLSTQRAKQHILSGEASRAFPYLLLALKLNPSLSRELSLPFSFCLGHLMEQLTLSRRFKEISTCISEALSIFPENKYLYRKYYNFITSYYPEGVHVALSVLRQVIAKNKWNLHALSTYEDICLWALERWHFRMINDSVRNSAYKNAIAKQVKNGKKSVLDIGTGSGLLSLFSAEAGAESVYGCDSLPAMASVARQVLDKHGLGKCCVIEKHSTEMSVPDDIPQAVRLLVCEIFDSGLLGEGVLQTLDHAWSNLIESNGSVVPSRATFYMCCVQCERVRCYNKLNNYPSDFGLEDMHIIMENEDYDTENLNNVPGGFKQMSDPIQVLTVDFNDRKDVKSTLRGHKDLCVTMKCMEEGWLDCVAGWFVLDLDDVTQLSTKPGSDVKCWDQVIFPFPTSQTVIPNQEISILTSFEEGKIRVTFPDPYQDKNVWKISSRVMNFINDKEYIKVLQETARDFIDHEGPCCIADFSPFPVLGLTILKLRNGGDCLISNCSTTDQTIVRKIAEDTESQIEFMSLEKAVEGHRKFDVVLVDVVDDLGCLTLELISSVTKIVKPNGHILPKKVKVWGQLVESEWLRRVSQVENDNALCPDIVRLLNEYKIFRHLDIRLESIDTTFRSSPFLLLKIEPYKHQFIRNDCTVPITAAGHVDATIYWYELQFTASSNSYQTKNSTHTNIAAILMDTFMSDSVRITTVYEDGYFISRVNEK